MKTKRLLFLFQKDLIPGISGEILDSKDQRDHVVLSPVSAWRKGFAWCFLGIANLAMLFYVFLFAVSQDSHHQSAWGQSFAIWLVLEVTMVSTVICLFMHVLVPSLVMKDIVKIKGKLRESLLKYYEKIESTKKDKMIKNMNSSLLQTFNAAKYLFLSYRLAETFPELKASQVILQYTTVWPRQSYQHVSDVSKNYNKKFSTAFSRSASIILIFFLTSFISLPLVIQDILTQIASTAVIGYLILLHLQLYAVIPILVVIPTLLLLVGIHFFLSSSSKREELEKAKLHHLLNSNEPRRSSQKQLPEKEEVFERDVTTIEGMKKQMNIVKPRGGHVTRKQSIQEGVLVMKELEGLKKEGNQDGRIARKTRIQRQNDSAFSAETQENGQKDFPSEYIPFE
jgi:rRNA-processing protein FCF1